MTLTTNAVNDALDLVDGYGQRSATFTFTLINGVTGGPLGELHPIRGATLTHDTSRTIKRNLQMNLGVDDTALINPLTDRVDVAMVVDGETWPLGRYMFTSDTRQLYTSGELANVALVDEMFIIDQEIEVGVNGRKRAVSTVISTVLEPFGVDLVIEGSDYVAAESWTVGARRGQILNTLATSGDYFSPWFGNDQKLHFIRSFDPATRVPDFDFDAGNRVFRASITQTNDLLTAPNRFVVISNAPEDGQAPVYGSADIPVTAPHSVPNRGFVIPKVLDLQVTKSAQAVAVAQNFARTQSVLEYVTVTTAPDPRHDSYNVIHWQGELWLETGWSMQLVEGGDMTHTLQRAYS